MHFVQYHAVYNEKSSITDARSSLLSRQMPWSFNEKWDEKYWQPFSLGPFSSGVVFYAKDCPQEKKLFSLIQAEISRAAIENSQATSREKYNSQIVLSNILT